MAHQNHRGWLTKHNEGILAAVYNGAMPGTTLLASNTALEGVLLGTPVTPALAVDSLVISNLVASGDILIATNSGGNSQAWVWVDTSAGLMTLYQQGVSALELGAGIVFNEGSADRDFRVETDGMAYAIYADGAKNALVLGGNTDISSADQLITIGRIARTATTTVNYFDLALAPVGAVTIPAGTTAIVAEVSIAEPNITATGTVTRAATLYIASQPTEGGTVNAAILFGAAANIACTTSLTFNEDSEDIDFRFESNGMAYAIYSDGGKDALVLGSNTDTSSVDQLITVSRAARTATAATNYYDFIVAPAGAVTVPAGVTALVASARFNEPNITATGTVTDACTVYIAGAPTEGSTGNYALWVGSGVTRLDNTVLINGSSAYTVNSVNFAVNNSADYGGMSLNTWSVVAAAHNSILSFQRSGSSTIGTHAIVTNADRVGTLDFTASDGVQFLRVARILANVDGVPGVDDMPGRLTFYTTADGAADITERLRIDSAGLFTITGNLQFAAAASINGTTSITVNDNSGDVDFIVESNGNANMFTVDGGLDAIGIGGVAVSGQTLTVTNTGLAATGRITKLSGTYAGAALTDGYGAFEVDVTLSNSPTNHSAAASAWVNITGGTVPVGTYICARNDGIYEEAAATITNAKLIFGARMQYIVSDTDSLRFPWSINTNNAAITALIDVNNLTDLGTVGNAGATAATLLPICRDAGGTLKYVLLYNLA